jgi:drug/metabolite transporter (DMT)-like permease
MILGLAVAGLWGTGDLLAALAARRIGAFRTVAIAQVLEMALCVAGWITFRPSPPRSAVSIEVLLLAGVLTAAAYGALYRGLILGPVMLVGPISAAYAIGPTFLAVVILDERLSTVQAIGAAAAIIGVVVVCAGHGRVTEHSGVRGWGGVPFAFAAMIAFAMSAFIITAFARETGWFATVLISRIGVAVTLALVALRPTRSWLVGSAQTFAPRPVGFAAIVGICNLAGTALYARAGELGLVAIVTPVSALFPLVPILGGYVFFRERLGAVQMGGIGMIIVGLVLLG